MNQPATETTPDDNAFSIRELSESCGVNAVTLRAWERRYGLLKPQRTAKGHRYYTGEDVERVRRIVAWLERGVAISKVKPLLAQADDSVATSVDDNSASHWVEAVKQALLLIGQFQREKLAQQLNELFASYPLDALKSNFFSPVQDALRQQVTLRVGGSAEKIFCDSEWQADLLSRIRHANSNNHGKPLLLIAFDGQQRSINALLLALALLQAGYRLHLLLDACALRDIPYIVEKAGVHAVICHSDSKPEAPQASSEIARAASHARVPFFIGGTWQQIEPSLSSLDDVCCLGLSLREAVQQIQQRLQEH